MMLSKVTDRHYINFSQATNIEISEDGNRLSIRFTGDTVLTFHDNKAKEVWKAFANYQTLAVKERVTQNYGR